jgi:hypothetical protein
MIPLQGTLKTIEGDHSFRKIARRRFRCASRLAQSTDLFKFLLMHVIPGRFMLKPGQAFMRQSISAQQLRPLSA